MYATIVSIILSATLLLGMFFNGQTRTEMQEAYGGEAVAMNFAVYRNAVNEYANRWPMKGQMEIPPSTPDLGLPQGWRPLRDWRAVVRRENGALKCYVYGPMEPGEVATLERLFHHSRAVGWNDNGTFRRNGDPMDLPAFIGDGYAVSAITIRE